MRPDLPAAELSAALRAIERYSRRAEALRRVRAKMGGLITTLPWRASSGQPQVPRGPEGPTLGWRERYLLEPAYVGC